MTVWSLCMLGYKHELDLLEIRLREQDTMVDMFIVAEAAYSYAGEAKPWLLNPAAERWAPWADRLRVVMVDDEPDYQEVPFQWFGERKRWQRENHQRRALGRAIPDTELEPGDVIVLSDLDEILRAETIQRYVDESIPYMVHPELPMHRHFLNLRWQDRMGISIARLLRGQQLIDLGGDVELARRQPPAVEWRVPHWNVYVDGTYDLGVYGWHFSWMGGPNAIEQKFHQAAHPEEVAMLATSGRTIKQALLHGLDLQGEGRELYWVPNSYLPQAALLPQFDHLLCPPIFATQGTKIETYERDYYWKG